MPTIPVWHHGRVLYQETGDGEEIPEPALLIHVDNGGTLVIDQEGRYITINRGTLKPLIAELRAELARGRKEG